MANNVLPLFWNLSSTNKKDRLDASEQLISSLEKFQSDFLATHSNVNGNEEAGDGDSSDDDVESGVEVSDDEDEDMEHREAAVHPEANGEQDEEEVARIRQMDKRFESVNSEDVKYSIKRLIRGLGSSRDSSRLGFAVALTELLSRLSALPSPPSASHILSLILRSSSPATGLKGSEERDLLFARLFGLNALVSSQLLTSGQGGGARTWNSCCAALIALGDRKAWLRESAWFSLIRAVRILLEGEGPEWKSEAVDGLLETIYKAVNEETGKRGLPWTQEKLALTILLQQLQPNLQWQSLLAPTFKNENILASQNLHALGRVLKEAEIEIDESAPSGAATGGGGTGGTGSWRPQPHFVWDIIFDAYFPQTSAPGLAGKVSFQEFFRVVVDESLFSPTSSPSRKFWGFEIFSKTLPLLPKTELPLVFTQNFMRVWMSQLSGQDRLLHKAALRVAEQIQSVTKSNPLVGFTLLSQLVGRHGSHNFDRLTQTKTVEGIMGNLSGDAVGDYVTYLKGLFYEQEEGEHLDFADFGKVEARRSWIFDQLLSLLRNSNMAKQDDWVWSILEFLLVHGLFVISKANKKSEVSTIHKTVKPPLSDSLVAACRSKFFSSVIEATVQTRVIKGDDDRSRKLHGSDSAGTLWLERCLQTIDQLEADSKHVSPAIEVDDEIREARKMAKATLTLIKKKSNADQDVARGVQVLLSFALLKSYDDDVNAYETLEDVHQCAERIFSFKSLPAAGDDDLPAVDLLVDVLIGYLDRASSDLRALATSVFGLISSKATSSTIEHLIVQLEATAGDADEDDEDSDDSDDEEDADADEDESMDSDVEEDDDDDDTAQVDPEFRRKVAEALQVAGMANGEDVDEDADEDDVDSDSDDVSISMDDDQMLQLDEKLGEIFKQQKEGKGTATSSAQDSIHFKARVLDLVEAFMKRQPQNALLLPLIPILLRLNQEIGTKDKQLGSKAGAVLQSRVVSHKEVPVIETKDVEVAGAALEAIHEIARGAASKEFLALCSHCSVFVSKALAHANMPSSSSKTGAPVEVVARTYAASLKEVMTKKNSRLHTSFISDLVQRQPEQAWSLRDDIVKYANGEGVNDHQQADAFNLMSAMAKRLTVISQTNDVAQVKAWIMSARKVLYDVLEKESSDSGTWQAPRIKDVIKTALQIARFSKPVLADEFAAAWGGDAAAALGEKLSQTKRLQNNASVRMLYGQFELFVSPSAQAAQLKRKEEKKKRRRNDGETTKGDVVAMDVDDKVDEVTPKKKGKGGKSTKTKGDTVAEGAKRTKKRKVVA